MQSSTRLSWGLLLGLLSGCQSQQAAFRFHPTPPVTVHAEVPLPSAAEPVATVATVMPAHAQRGKQPRLQTHRRPVAATPAKAAAPQRLSAMRHLVRSVVQRKQPETAVAVQPNQPTRHDTLHIILGALLVVGGVIGGIALGGWLGLGVGALVVLLGYYFLVLGIGGKHAWLEIFQEFFNM
ncbi:hypothetical protein [Hymenobacter sp. UYP22]|uniref:hypothetical protein n=1 Tax=Hymenobacter sp. UYP22 TaxID=3156348 RepID=UPI00339B4EA1